MKALRNPLKALGSTEPTLKGTKSQGKSIGSPVSKELGNQVVKVI